MKLDNGFTLIELVSVIGIVSVVIGVGMNIFYQTLRGGSRVDFELVLDSSSRAIENSINSLVGFAEVVEVAGQDRGSCFDLVSVSGDSLTIKKNDWETVYSLSGERIASVSAAGTVFISPVGVDVASLDFVWTCQPGYHDQVDVGYLATAKKDDQPTPISRRFSFSVLIKNSSY